ncbi:MAG: MFS transporter, partial [Planctomycetaceae bacterium]
MVFDLHRRTDIVSQTTPALSSPPPSKLTTVQWLVCIIASIGFAFDIYELLMLPLIARPALQELLGPNVVPGNPEFHMWVGRLFFIPAFAGGLVGLVGGYLTDRLGRRRVLTWSILIYAFAAFFAGFSTSIWMLLTLRCFVFIGVCVEFVAAVAWLAELFPERERRERVLGYTQAFSSVGGLLVAVAAGLAATYSEFLPGIPLLDWLPAGDTLSFNGHGAWRYTLMSGLIPAFPLIVIRPFLPESPSWQAKKEAGALKRPSLGQLFAPDLRRATIITTLMFACSFGAAFGALQQIQQIVPAIPEVKAELDSVAKETRAAISKAAEGDATKAQDTAATAKKVGAAVGKRRGEIVSQVTKVQEIGGLIGRFLLAFLVVRVLSQRKLIRIFLIPGLLVIPFLFGYALLNNITLVYVAIFFAGLLTVGQFSFWGNYLPRVYPLHLRGTGESFAANIGGRMIGTSFAWVTQTLATTS